jgi:hypothetical protein
MNKLIYVVILISSINITSSGASDQIYRTFTSTDGKAVEARIAQYDESADTVSMVRKDDGKRFSVPVTMFMENDQVIIRNWDAVKHFLDPNGLKVTAVRKVSRLEKPAAIEGEFEDSYTEEVTYDISFENKASETFSNLSFQYSALSPQRRFSDEGVKDDFLCLATGETKIQDVPPKKALEIKNVHAGYQRKSHHLRSDDIVESKIIGIWIRLYLQLPDGEKVMREFKKPTSVWNDFVWTGNEPERMDSRSKTDNSK